MLTYNIHSSIRLDKRPDWQGSAAVIRQVNADVIGLQEVAINHHLAKGMDVPCLLGDFLKVNRIFGKTIPLNDGRGEYGIAALSPHPMMLGGNHPPACAGRTRAAYRAGSQDRGSPPVLFYRDPFLAWKGVSEQRRQPGTGRSTHYATVKNKRYTPVILVGDFNSPPETPPLNAARDEWLICNDRNPEPSFPADQPDQLIDYILGYPKTA